MTMWWTPRASPPT